MMVLVEKDDDFSFLPLSSNGRQLDYSRFDTGGVENAQSPQALSTYLFTDRGIYRPGETTHLGLITRTADWTGTLSGLPLEVEITNSRGTLVNRTSLKLSATALEEITYTSQPASPTGTYQATAFLVKDQRRRELLGSTSFKVQEFEPDRMKVQLTLSDQAANAWLNTADVLPKAVVAHLFGEAASNRRVDGEISLTPVLPQFSRYPDYRFQIGEGTAADRGEMRQGTNDVVAVALQAAEDIVEYPVVVGSRHIIDRARRNDRAGQRVQVADLFGGEVIGCHGTHSQSNRLARRCLMLSAM